MRENMTKTQIIKPCQNATYNRYLFHPKNILKFRTNNTPLVSDDELVSLFMGIIRLVRQDERESVVKELCDMLKQ